MWEMVSRVYKTLFLRKRLKSLCLHSLIYHKTAASEGTEDEDDAATNAVGIQTMDKKEAANILQLENGQPRKRRPR